MNDEIERLIQDALDGVATPEQESRLREILATDPEARQRQREVAAVFHALEGVKTAEAPDLRGRVLSAIGREAQAGATRSSWTGSLRRAFARRPGLALAYAFGAGAVVSALALAFATGALTRGGRASLPVSATMVSPTSSAHAHREVTVGGATVVLESRRLPGAAEVLVASGAAPDARITLEYDAAALRVSALDWGRPGAGRASLEPGRIHLEPQGADCRIEFTIVGAPPPVIAVVERAAGSARETLDVKAPEENR